MKIFYILLGVVMVSLLFWVVGVRDIQTLRRQSAAESFPSVTGLIEASDVVTWTGNKGREHYGAAFTYKYVVNGRGYRCQRYRYDRFPTDADVVRRVVAAHPIYSEVTVYYNPENPYDAVLSPQVEAEDVSRLFLHMPIMLVFVFIGLKTFQRRDRPADLTRLAGGVKLITERLVTRARLPRYLPCTTAVVVTGILSLLAGILIDLRVPTIPPLTAGAWSLAVVLLGGLAVFGWRYFNIASGKQDLVIDEAARTVQLPLTYKRREQTPLAFTEIKSVRLKRVPHSTRAGVFYSYTLTLWLASGKAERLTELNRKHAEALAIWLREKLGLPAKTMI